LAIGHWLFAIGYPHVLIVLQVLLYASDIGAIHELPARPAQKVHTTPNRTPLAAP
jgi:hypothetical protein